MRGLVHIRKLGCILLAAAAVTLGPTHDLVAQLEADRETPSRSGLWVRAGLDFGVLRADSAHYGSGGGADIAAGWTLSPHWTLGARAVVNRSSGAEGSHTVLVGPQIAWHPSEEVLLALRGGISLLNVRAQGAWLSPEGTLHPREQRYKGQLWHLALTAAQPLESGVLAEFGVEVGYAPFGRWRDTSPEPVRGQPWMAALSLTFGVD
jgi:hypothetical protein